MGFEEALSGCGWSEGAGGTVGARRRRCSYPAQRGTSEAGQRPAMLWKSSDTPPLTRTALDPARICWAVPTAGGHPRAEQRNVSVRKRFLLLDNPFSNSRQLIISYLSE